MPRGQARGLHVAAASFASVTVVPQPSLHAVHSGGPTWSCDADSCRGRVESGYLVPLPPYPICSDWHWATDNAISTVQGSLTPA